MSDECKSIWRRIYEGVVLPVDEYDEFAGSVEAVAAKLRTDDEDVATALLDEAEKIHAEAFERADGAERRATTLQGAVAIAASFGLASGALLLDTNKIRSDGWRQAFAVLSFGFVFCLVAAGFRAVAAVYRVHYWKYPDVEAIYDRAKVGAAEGKTLRAAALLRTVSRNQAIARWKVAYMRAAGWWFRWALLFLLADALLLVLYAFVGTRFPHIALPWGRTDRVDLFFDRDVPLAAAVLAIVGMIVLRLRARPSGRPAVATPRRLQAAWVLLLAAGFIGAVALDHVNRGWQVHRPPLRDVGLVVAVLAVVWLIWTYRRLGRSLTGGVAPGPDHKLQTDGPYTLVRHPSYLGYALLSVAAALIWSTAALIATAAVLVVGYWAAALEEYALLAHDRTAYERYRNCTRDRVVPGDRAFGTSQNGRPRRADA